MDCTLTGTAIGLFAWNVYLLWRKFKARKKESRIKSLIEQQAELLIQEVAPYKKFKTINGSIQQQPNQDFFQIFTCQESGQSNQSTQQKTVLDEVRQEKFLECKYFDGDSYFKVKPFEQKKTKKSKKNNDFSFASQPKIIKNEVKRCRKFSNIAAMESNDDNNETPPVKETEKQASQLESTAIKNIEEKCNLNEIQFVTKQKTPPQSPKIVDSKQIQPHEFSLFKSQTPATTEPVVQQESNMFASLLSNVKKNDDAVNTQPQQIQQQGLFSNLINQTNEQKVQEAPQQQGQAGLFSNLLQKTNEDPIKTQPNGGLFANFSHQPNLMEDNQKLNLDVKPSGLFGNNLITEQASVPIQTEALAQNTGGLFNNPQPTTIPQPVQQQSVQQSFQQPSFQQLFQAQSVPQPVQQPTIQQPFQQQTVSQPVQQQSIQPVQQQPQQQGLFSGLGLSSQTTQNSQGAGLFGNLSTGLQAPPQQAQTTRDLFAIPQSKPQQQSSGLFASILNSKPQEGGLFSNVQPPQQQQSLFNQQQPQVQPQQQAQQIIQTFGSPQIFGQNFLQNNTVGDPSKNSNNSGQLMQGGLFNLNSTSGGGLFDSILKK